MHRSLAAIAAFMFLVTCGVASAATCNFNMNSRKMTMRLMSDCTVTTPSERVVIPQGYTLDGSGHTITASGAYWLGAVVTNGGTVANVMNLTVTADNIPCACHGGDNRLRGIYFAGASGTIKNVTVMDLRQLGNCGCQEGNGIEVRNTPLDCTGNNPFVVTIQNNTVQGFQKNGITCNGNSYCSVLNNTIEGLDQVPFIAQNGIQFGYGGTGKALGNMVAGHWYTGVNWASTGILIFEASNVDANDNVVPSNQIGATVESWHYQCADAFNNHIAGNTITDSEWGIVVDALSYGGVSTGDAHADYNHVSDNGITNTLFTGEAGVYLGVADYYGGGFLPVAYGNTVSDNTISGFTADVVHDGDTGTKGGQFRLMSVAPAAVSPSEP